MLLADWWTTNTLLLFSAHGFVFMQHLNNISIWLCWRQGWFCEVILIAQSRKPIQPLQELKLGSIQVHPAGKFPMQVSPKRTTRGRGTARWIDYISESTWVGPKGGAKLHFESIIACCKWGLKCYDKVIFFQKEKTFSINFLASSSLRERQETQ